MSSIILRSLDLQYRIVDDSYRAKIHKIKKAAESAAFFILYSLSGLFIFFYIDLFFRCHELITPVLHVAA